MHGIDPAQQFAFIKAKADGVISLSRARRPCWFLTGQNNRQPVEIGDDLPVNRLVKGKQSGLVG